MLVGCGNDEGKTVINYCKALEAGKLDEAESYLSKDAKQELARVGGKSRLAAAGGQFKQHRGIGAIKISGKKVAGEITVVDFVYNFNDGSKYNDSFPLIKENGTWKISK